MEIRPTVSCPFSISNDSYCVAKSTIKAATDAGGLRQGDPKHWCSLVSGFIRAMPDRDVATAHASLMQPVTRHHGRRISRELT